jgi:hypothetical protein
VPPNSSAGQTLNSMIAWLMFPLVPTCLGMTYYQTLNRLPNLFQTSDPRGWDRLDWILQLGPLLGFGFLAGATSILPETALPNRGRFRRWFAQRWLIVSVAPWSGFLTWAFIVESAELSRRFDGPTISNLAKPEWLRVVFGYGFVIPTLAYAWVIAGITITRRAMREGLLRRSLIRGLITSVAFVGSLFGSFWAATSAWRSYFFDPTVAPLLFISGIALVSASGCASTTTLGEVRRHELFDALLPGWLIGMALIWRWSSRRKSH